MADYSPWEKMSQAERMDLALQNMPMDKYTFDQRKAFWNSPNDPRQQVTGPTQQAAMQTLAGAFSKR